jgi:hypothetical protein
MSIGSGIDLSPGFTAFARPGVVGMPLKEELRSRGTQEKRVSRLAERKAAAPVCKLWAVKPGRMGLGSTVSGLPNAKNLETRVAEVTGAAEPGCRRAKLSKAQQPTNQPATWKHLPSQPTSNCQPSTTSASDPSFDFDSPLHRATNSIAPEHQLSTSSVAAAASRSNLQNDGRLVSRSRAGLFPSKHAAELSLPCPNRQHQRRRLLYCGSTFIAQPAHALWSSWMYR